MDITTFSSLIIQVLVGMSQKSLFHKPEDCYFCVTDASGHSYKTRKHITYADLSNVMKSQKLDSMEDSCANNVEFEEVEALDQCEDTGKKRSTFGFSRSFAGLMSFEKTV